MIKRFVFIMVIVSFIACKNRTTAIDYIGYKDSSYISVIQFHEIMNPEEKAIYILNGKVKNRIPKSNFLKLRYCDYPAYYKVKDDTSILVLRGWDIQKNIINNTKFLILNDFPENDKIEFGYYQDRQAFFKKISKNYVSFDRYVLKTDW